MRYKATVELFVEADSEAQAADGILETLENSRNDFLLDWRYQPKRAGGFETPVAYGGLLPEESR